jgi:cytoskeleton protein RodZ
MDGAPAEPTAVSPDAQPQPHSWLTSPWLILLLLGLLVLVAVPVALYWWLNSAGEDGPGKQALSAAQTRFSPAVPVPVTEPAEAAPPAVELAPVAPAAPAAETPETPRQDEAGTPEAPAINGVLHLEFGDESWVEVKDASGRMLHRQLNPAGTSADIPGQPPFDVVIGNAAQVRLTYNGRPIDLEPFIEVTVARFTLEE